MIPRLSKLKEEKRKEKRKGKEKKPEDFLSPILPIIMPLAALGTINIGGGGAVSPAPPLFQENLRKLNLSLAFQIVLNVYSSV